MLTGVFKDATISPPPNLHTCLLLVKVYQFGQCFGERFLPLSTLFSLVSSRAFRDAPHSRFRRGDPNQCSPNFIKMLLLALPQIYTRVFHLWKSVALDNTWVKDTRPFITFFHLRVFARLAMRHTRVFLCGDLKLYMLTGLFKNASFGPPPNLHKCIALVEVYRFGQCLG